MVDFYSFNTGYTYEDYLSMSEIDINKIFYKIYYKEHYIDKGAQFISKGLSLSNIHDAVLNDIWEEVARLRGDDIHNHVPTEKVIVGLIHSGVPKEKIHYLNGTFFIPMKNTSWICNRLAKDFWIQPGKQYQKAHFFLSMDGTSIDAIVKLILWFDEVVIPLFQKNFVRFERICRKHALKIQTEQLTQKVIENSLNIICEDTLSPHDIKYKITYRKGSIGFSFNKYLYGKFELPLQEAEILFQNPEYMVSKMTPPDVKNKTDIFTTHKDFWKWTIIPEKESPAMKRLRDLARRFLAPYQISVAVAFRDGKAIIDAMQIFSANEYGLTLEQATELVFDREKVFEIMKKDFDSRNFLNLDRSGTWY